MRQTEEQRKLEEMRRQKEEEMLQKRQEYVEKTKNALVFDEMPSEKPGKKGKRTRTDQYVSDSGGSDRDEGREEVPKERKRKRKPSGETKEKRSKGKGRRRKDAGSGNSGKRELIFTLSFCIKCYTIIRFNYRAQHFHKINKKVISKMHILQDRIVISRNASESRRTRGLKKKNLRVKVRLRLLKVNWLNRRKLFRRVSQTAIRVALKSPAGKHDMLS